MKTRTRSATKICDASRNNAGLNVSSLPDSVNRMSCGVSVDVSAVHSNLRDHEKPRQDEEAAAFTAGSWPSKRKDEWDKRGEEHRV